MFDRNDPPGLGAHLSNEDRWGVCHDAAEAEIERDPHLFNKKYGTDIGGKDWQRLLSEEVFKDIVFKDLQYERAEELFALGNGAGEDDPREER